MVKIALLSHRGGNIGHDFMAIGISEALENAFGKNLIVEHFEQHKHFEVYPKNHWLRLFHEIPHGRFKSIRRFLNTPYFRYKNWPKTNKLNYNLAVACGGPNIVPNGSQSPELGLMLHHLNGAFKYRGVPLIDAGVGACFPLENKVYQLENLNDQEFYKTALHLTYQITVRDKVAKKIVKDLGAEAKLIPCAAIGFGLAVEKKIKINHKTRELVAINFQRVGANTDWDQNVDPDKWIKTMRCVIDDLKKRHSLLILAQNKVELKLARELAPDIKCIMPSSVEEYASVISNVKVAIVSRVHAAIPLASIGIPSVVVGTDTRLGTIEEFGLPTCFVKKANKEWLIDKLETLLTRTSSEHERLLAARSDTLNIYSKLFVNSVREL